MIGRSTAWTHPSVLALAGDLDPVEVITDKARDVAMLAYDRGWTGPPFDPFALADFLKIKVVARYDVRDARTVPVGRSDMRIEFNPSRARGRLRYSI